MAIVATSSIPHGALPHGQHQCPLFSMAQVGDSSVVDRSMQTHAFGGMPAPQWLSFHGSGLHVHID